MTNDQTGAVFRVDRAAGGIGGRFAGRLADRAARRVTARSAAAQSTGEAKQFRQDTLDNVYDYRQSDSPAIRRQTAAFQTLNPRAYVTRKFLDHVTPSLSDRDLDIITTIARFGLVTSLQIVSLYFTPTTTILEHGYHQRTRTRRAQKILQRLTDLQFLERLQRRVGGARAGSAGYIYGLGPAGHRLLELPGVPRRVREPLSPHIDHTLCVTDLYVRLVTAQRQHRLTVLDHRAEPECWEEASGLWLKPDAYVRVETADGRRCRWYVELDRGGPRGAQSERRIQAKLDQYVLFWQRRLLDVPVFPRVVFVAVSDSRVAQLQVIIDKQPQATRPLFAAVAFTDAVNFLGRAGGPEPALINPLRALRRGLLGRRAARGDLRSVLAAREDDQHDER